MLKLKSNNLAAWCEEPTDWKRPWCWERLKVGREGDDRGWDGWMASPTQWTRVWVNSRSWWWTGRPGVLWSKGSQSQTQLSDWTKLTWTEYGVLSVLWALSRFLITIALKKDIYFNYSWVKWGSVSLHFIWKDCKHIAFSIKNSEITV